MFFGMLDAVRWQPVDALRAHDEINATMLAVLAADAPLMHFLSRRFGLSLSLDVRDQRIDAVQQDEVRWLAGLVGAPAIRRRACLRHRDQPMIEAEAVLPLAGLADEVVKAVEKEERPLGELLVAHGLHTDRTTLFAARLAQGRWRDCWVRCSVLTDGHAQVLVAEVFLPMLWERLCR